jgi:hypothetical protein
MNSSLKFSYRPGLVPASVILMLLALFVMPVQSVMAQDEDPDEIALDGSCRSVSSLSLIPGVLSDGFFTVLADGSAEVFLTLNPNHRMDQTAPYACNKDKFRWVINKSFNVCVVEQPIRGGFRVWPCTPGINMLFWVKIKFSENFNINGGVTVPRIKDAPIVIDVEQQFGTIPDIL